MKALRLHGKKDLRVENLPEPSSIGPRQVVLRPTFCGICGTDLHEYAEGPTWVPKTPHPLTGAMLPQVLGHEFAGRIVAVGSGVTSLKVGHRVSIQPQISPTDDYYGRRGLGHVSSQMATIGLSWGWGGMSELALVNEVNAIELPDSVSDEQGSLIEPAAVAVNAMDRGGVVTGSTVLVTGGGPIGALVALAARTAGASLIVVSEPNPRRREAIQGMDIGAVCLDPAADDVAGYMRAHTEEGVGADVAIECAGIQPALLACLDAVRRRGNIVQVGLFAHPVMLDPFTWASKNVTMVGVVAYPLSIWPRVIAMVGSGLFPIEKIITGRVNIDDAVPNGFDALLAKGSTHMKILVTN